jgi:hypothetical protein
MVIERDYNMNDIYFITKVLAHGFDVDRSSGVLLLMVMALFIFGLFVYRKDARIPKGLFASSIISYLLVLMSIMEISFELEMLDIWGFVCFMAIFYLNFPMVFIFGTGSVFFFAAFIADTLIIFGMVRLILFIKQKISAKKSKAEQTE